MALDVAKYIKFGVNYILGQEILVMCQLKIFNIELNLILVTGGISAEKNSISCAISLKFLVRKLVKV